MRRALVELDGPGGARTIAVIAEEPIYEWRGVLVSTSRFAFDGRSYPISDVRSVLVLEPRSRSMIAFASAGLAAVLAISALVFGSMQYAVAAAALVVIALVSPAKVRHLAIEFATERLMIRDSNPAVIAEIADAISVAKRSVHTAKREPVFAGDRAPARAARVSGAA